MEKPSEKNNLERIDIKTVEYLGNILSEPKPDTISRKEFKIEPKNNLIPQKDIPAYFPSDELKAAIRYARLLERPLLLRGEPGCGKTKLAQALAYELYHDKEYENGSKVNYRDHYFEWYIKSTTKAVDGIYTYDHLARLRDIQPSGNQNNNNNEGDTISKEEELKQKKKYRKFGPLGKAILASKPNMPTVLLIDEIDKADIDFPNDLLLELDQKRFFIEETEEEFIAEESPIIIITSNDEKELPDAFLRRCVFHYIDFPGKQLLLDIIKSKAKEIIKKYHKDTKNLPEELLENIRDKFDELYAIMKANPATDKRPSTSELLDWLEVIHEYLLKDGVDTKTKEERAAILEKKALPDDRLLFIEVLLKSLDDQKYAREKYKYLSVRKKTENLENV